VTSGGQRVLLDCGLFQGLKSLRQRNWTQPALTPRDLNAVVLSHAHIDHSGYLPLLVRQGFRGPIYCTSGTADLLKILLPDSGRLQEEDAERANRHQYSRHHPALPLYTEDDAYRSLKLLHTLRYHESKEVAKGITSLFRPAGHILGSATIELGLESSVRLVYTGDVGRLHHPFLRPAEPIPAADFLVIESTYGDRVHAAESASRLAAVVNQAVERGGMLLVPAFAVGRTQELLWLLRQLEDEHRVPVLPIYVDSPMAVDVTTVTSNHPEDLSVEPASLRDATRNPFRASNVHYARSPAESRAINQLHGPIIIISASGMATGGRVLHHLRLRLPDERTTVLLPGFQAVGTRGRLLQDGAKEIRIHGQSVPVRARVEQMDGLSAHADRDELLQWLASFERPPRTTFVVHGEATQATGLARALAERLGWNARTATDGETAVLG
jgi:metallo-beta-lactamase family protein